MKKLVLVLAVLTVVAGFSSVAFAQEASMKGKIGVGYANAGTPLGLKMWLSDGFALDLGLGVNTAATQSFGFQIGAALQLAKKGPVSLQLRPAVGMDFGGVTNLNIPIMMNIEYFIDKSVSLSAGSGIMFQVVPAFVFSHCVVTTSNLGVIYYF